MSRFQYTPRSPYQVFLRLLEPEAVFFALARSLDPIGKAIQECTDIIDLAVDSGNVDYSEAVTDEEGEIIESLLGTAFVICQTHITCVVSRIKELHSFFQARETHALDSLNVSKGEILKQGADILAGTTYSSVQAIDAFANYFKHREEWPSDWTQLCGHQVHTRDVISAFGVASGSHNNLRTGAEALGNTEYRSVSLFADKLEVWRTNLRKAYEEQLKAEDVI
jgi:hypothetical protein